MQGKPWVCPNAHAVASSEHECGQCGAMWSQPPPVDLSDAPAGIEPAQLTSHMVGMAGGRGGRPEAAETRGTPGEMMLGCSLMIGVAALLAWGVKAWTGSWWGIPVVMILVAACLVAVSLAAPERRGRVGCASLLVAVILIAALFPAIRGSEPAPGESGHNDVDLAAGAAELVWGGYTAAEKDAMCRELDYYGWDEAGRQLRDAYGPSEVGGVSADEYWAALRPLIQSYC